jgi:hypothetical protein
MKKFLIVFLVLLSCNNPYSRSTDYYEAVAGHIVQIIITGKCNSECLNSIVSSELKYLTYTEAMYFLDNIGKRLPKIFKSVERELENKVEEKYKKSVVK